MKILLVCSGGMSTAIVVKAIEQQAAKTGRDIAVKSVGSGEFPEAVRGGWDVVLVAPQVRPRLAVIHHSPNRRPTAGCHGHA